MNTIAALRHANDVWFRRATANENVTDYARAVDESIEIDNLRDFIDLELARLELGQ